MYLPVEPGRLIEGRLIGGRKIEDALYYPPGLQANKAIIYEVYSKNLL